MQTNSNAFSVKQFSILLFEMHVEPENLPKVEENSPPLEDLPVVEEKSVVVEVNPSVAEEDEQESLPQMEDAPESFEKEPIAVEEASRVPETPKALEKDEIKAPDPPEPEVKLPEPKVNTKVKLVCFNSYQC